MRLLPRRVAVLVAGALLLTVGLSPPASSAGVGSAEAGSAGGGSAGVGGAGPVLEWSRIATQTIVAGRPPASSEVLLGIVHVAIADTVAGLGYGRPFKVAVRPDRRASAAAAVATAAYDVLRARVPNASGLDSTYADYLAGVPAGRAKDRGVALGQSVAAAVLAWRAGDGLGNTVPYVQRTPGPGVWEPTLPTPPVDIVLTQVRPLALRYRAQFRPGGPDALTSKRYARDVAEVASVGRKDSVTRTAWQTETALFWSEQTAQQWSRALLQLARDRHLSLSGAANMLALAHVSAGDSVIACWDAKFHYLSWRPVHAVQRGDTDGNPLTEADPSWQSLLNGNHPEYPSGHACFTAGVAGALQAFFHTSQVRLEMSSVVTGTTRVYPNLPAVRADVQEARIASGLHFRHSMTDGDALGTRVAGWISARH
ncbi:vanadium-dependent haloperoxidase [Kribbella sp. NPDC000426]|uniref:vanadium-dependent haloperoxidase n=1 Tax=Kribbella sp. NPDC000426 TaxID=3154255 RepID=UPI00331C3EA2